MRKFRFSRVWPVVLFGATLLGTTLTWALTTEQEAKLLPTDGEEYDHFGNDVALDGDTALVGAPASSLHSSDSGSVFVFSRSAGEWSEQAELLPGDAAADDTFGIRVALDGDTAIIGAKGDDDNGDNAGAAYVFVRTAGVWTEQAKLLASDGADLDGLGLDVALHGDTAVVGATGNALNGIVMGSAYVFVRTAGVWTEQARLLPPDGDHLDRFGYSIAVDDDTVLIGAPETFFNDGDHGSAYVFTRDAGVWTIQAKLVPSDASDNQEFGWAVALHGDTAIVGSDLDDASGYYSGSAYVFTRAEGVWTEQVKLVPEDGEEWDQFGCSVALEGDTALIGAYDDYWSALQMDSAYVFTRTAGVWTEQTRVRPADGADWKRFGQSVALDGDTAVVGADSDDDQGSFSGSAYVFRLIPGDGGDGGVPAVGEFGTVLTLLIVGSIGFYSVRRGAH